MQAKDLKPGWWFDCGDGELAMAIHKSDRWPSIWVAKRGNTGPIQYPLAGTTEVTHHPNCTGWDWPIPKRVKLEVGKRYVMRCGGVTEPLELRKCESKYTFVAVVEVNGERFSITWTELGQYHEHRQDDEYDIVAEYVEPETCDCYPAELETFIPFTQHTFRKHADKWLYEKSQPSHWFRVQEIKPHAVLIGALWVEWDRLLAGFEFVGSGVCGEEHG